MRTDDEQIMCDLISQVMKAVPNRPSANEQDVTTIITRPMWNAFCRAVGIPEDSKPTEWNGIHSKRVYGSRTIVVESVEMLAVSFAGPISELPVTLPPTQPRK